MTRSEYLPLDLLLTHGRSGGRVVAWKGLQPKTWEDFLIECGAWKAALAGLKAKRIALYHPETWDFACALFGAWAAGLEPCVPGDALPATCSALGSLVDAFVGDFPSGLGKPLLKSAAGGGALPGWRAPEGFALRVFSSGSTGKPEAFAKSFAQLSAEISCLEEAFGARFGSAAILATVSHQHIYGLLFKLLWPLCAGREILSQSLFYPEEILAASRRFPSAALVSSPAHLKRLPAGLDWAAVKGQWRAVFSSGGPLSWEAAKHAGALLGRAPFEVYGSTETGGIAWRERSAEDSPWIKFSDVELELEAGSGLLRVRSPKLPDEKWFTTADRAKLKNDGSLELLGRQDRILKIEEKRISLSAIEAALLGTGLVLEARVLALPSERESLGAVIALSPQGWALEKKALQERLRSAVAARVERVGLPKRWRFVQALPLNAQGKSPEAELLKLFEDVLELP